MGHKFLYFNQCPVRHSNRSVIGWLWRKFVSYLSMPAGFRCHLVVKLLEMFVIVLSIKYAFGGKLMIRWTFFLKYLVKFYLNNTVNLHPLTPHITPSYTHKMRTYRDHWFCDVISPYVSYSPICAASSCTTCIQLTRISFNRPTRREKNWRVSSRARCEFEQTWQHSIISNCWVCRLLTVECLVLAAEETN